MQHHPLLAKELVVRSWRNLSDAKIVPAPRLNVFHGDNGQGKTAVLEALYAAATTKSFRTSRVAEAIRYGDEIAHLSLTVAEDDVARVQSMAFRAGARQCKIDGTRPKTLVEYASHSPVVVFHPGEMQLSMGAGTERRKLMDRVLLYLDPSSIGELESYSKAQRARQKILEVRGERSSDLDAWEELLVRHGSSVLRARLRVAKEVRDETVRAFQSFGTPSLELGVEYLTNTPSSEEMYRSALRASRGVDARRRSASIGPHRDDLVLTIDSHSVRTSASQGQHRAVVMSLKVAEIRVIERARGVVPIFMLDDISSELDADRLSALLQFLLREKGQLFLTTPRPDLIPMGESLSEGRADFRVREGRLVRA